MLGKNKTGRDIQNHTNCNALEKYKEMNKKYNANTIFRVNETFHSNTMNALEHECSKYLMLFPI